MKKALIITYNGDDGTSIDKPFQVLIDNASTAVRKQREKWLHLTRQGVKTKHLTKTATMQTIQLKGINAAIQNNYFICSFTDNKSGTGQRLMVISDNSKVFQKYIAAGYYIFGSPTQYTDKVFLKLTKQFTPATQNKRKIVINNELWHIENHIQKGNKITFEIQQQ